MNKRIQELIKQSERVDHYAADYTTGDYFPVMTVDGERLAQLIVRECAKFLEDNSGYDECNQQNNAWHPEPEDLLNHFGVEE